jgi:phosphoribosylglycinamide formyltransferase-1
VTRRRVGVLISGRGSNFSALLQATRQPDYPAEIVCVVSNEPRAAGLDLARSAGIPALAVDHRAYGRDRAAHERAMQPVLELHGVELLCLAGYMRLLTPFLVERWLGRILNIHPSLLPAFPGLHTHARAIEAGVKLHGCTVHLVTQTMDEGPILGQAAVPVLPGDDEAALAGRVLVQEHALYPATLRAFLERSFHVPEPDARLINPLPVTPATPY